MKLLRKLLILSHRYLGIALCLLVAMWFASGIVMMYAGGMPRLDPELRLARMPDLDLSKVRLTLADAAEKLDIDASAGWDSTAGRGGSRIQLLTVMDRPAYRVGGEGTVFADTGEVLGGIDEAKAQQIAARFLNLEAAIEAWIAERNTKPKPFKWTAKADTILEKNARVRQVLAQGNNLMTQNS